MGACSQVQKGMEAATDGLMQIVSEQAGRIRELEESLQSAHDKQEISAAVAKQTIRKLMEELTKSDAAAQRTQQHLLEFEQQIALLENRNKQAEAELQALHDTQMVELKHKLELQEAHAAELQGLLDEKEQMLLELRSDHVQADQQAQQAVAQLEALQAELQAVEAAAKQAEGSASEGPRGELTGAEQERSPAGLAQQALLHQVEQLQAALQSQQKYAAAEHAARVAGEAAR